MSGIERKETSYVNFNSGSDYSLRLIIDEGNSSTEIEESDQPMDILVDRSVSGRTRPIGFDEAHSVLTRTGVENPEMSEQMDIPLDLSGRDGRMPREFWNPSGHVHSANIPRMEESGVGIAQPSTSSSFFNHNLPGSNQPTFHQDLRTVVYENILQSQFLLEQIIMRLIQYQQSFSNPQARAAYDLPGTSFGSNQPTFPDLIPVYENILQSQFFLDQFLPRLLQQFPDPEAREVVPAAPEHPSGYRSQGYEQLNREDRECPREDHMEAEHENSRAEDGLDHLSTPSVHATSTSEIEQSSEEEEEEDVGAAVDQEPTPSTCQSQDPNLRPTRNESQFLHPANLKTPSPLALWAIASNSTGSLSQCLRLANLKMLSIRADNPFSLRWRETGYMAERVGLNPFADQISLKSS
ncbi:Hypothetical predicted protein [Cloeon dipterum]|uniref:Uncharacterized protein n=1 Tax=Cloeon dipterum TaxID=197152 RepID=A0A8S1CNG5_9INSE|nr:Hypothetical predicted protein [Cloeon dipterum]